MELKSTDMTAKAMCFRETATFDGTGRRCSRIRTSRAIDKACSLAEDVNHEEIQTAT